MNNDGKPTSKSNSAGKTNNQKKSLVECIVETESGEWVSPEKSKTFYIDQNAKFPDITYEIKTDCNGPYTWSWKIFWEVKACPQKSGKKRFKAKHSKTYVKQGSFTSYERKWKCDFGEVIGGILSVKVKAGSSNFVRKSIILGKDPGETRIHAELDTYAEKKDASLVKKIFKQETQTKHFYTDEMPLVSFDNGYGLGQLTNPAPTYEQIWNWKKHVKTIMDTIKSNHRKRAKNYLDQHNNYTDDMLDLETLASYNGLARGQHYHNWNTKLNKWVVNTNVTCDPEQSNKGWLMTEEENEGKSIEELRKNKKSKPFYTGRCYAEHIKNNQ